MIELSTATLGFPPPPPAPSIGRYAPFIQHGGVVAIVQGPLWGDELRYVGRVGEDVDFATAQEAARLCCANVLLQLQEACAGDLTRVKACFRLGGFINAAPSFTAHSQVMNAASDLLHRVLGDTARHSRYVVGCSSLPSNLVLELEGWFAID